MGETRRNRPSVEVRAPVGHDPDRLRRPRRRNFRCGSRPEDLRRAGCSEFVQVVQLSRLFRQAADAAGIKMAVSLAEVFPRYGIISML